MIEKQKIESAVFEAVEQVNKLLPPKLRLGRTLDEPIVSENSKLDSLGLINFLVSLEQQLEKHTGEKIILTKESDYDENSFGTIGKLVDHIAGQMDSK